MSYSYLPTTSTSAYRPARQDSLARFSVFGAVHGALPSWATQGLSAAAQTASGHLERLKNRNELKSTVSRAARWLFTITNGLILLWIWTLWWGERGVFQESLESCAWGSWEKWVRYLGLFARRMLLTSVVSSPQTPDLITLPSSLTPSSSTLTLTPAARGRSRR
ncbi:hypothetical protein BJX63DRAFT_411370 [Aspergillus granulosus]|uniref:Uncharacterized protein n=1 Tax=Aspergillus granulosus TaxID=176169 RepID=A0ABR4GX01_9EURO